MTPQGALTHVKRRIASIGREGDRADLDLYLRSEEFARAAQFFEVISGAIASARQDIRRRHRPLMPGKRRAQWTAEAVERFKATWAKHDGNAYRVGRELRITEWAAISAHRRFMVVGAPPVLAKPPRKPREGQLGSRTPFPVPVSNESVAGATA